RCRWDRPPGDRDGPRTTYAEKLAEVYHDTLQALEEAYNAGKRFVLFVHGSSTSRRGKETSRSVVRKVMRSKAATPYIIRRECIQHETVFVAAIRQREAN